MPEIVLTHPFVQFCWVQLNDAACWYAAKIYTRWLLYSLLPATAGCEAWLVNAVVDSFTESHSVRCLEILAGMNEPHDKVRYACVILLCPMTNYELLRWLVETLSRDIRHYRILNVSVVNGSTFLMYLEIHTIAWVQVASQSELKKSSSDWLKSLEVGYSIRVKRCDFYVFLFHKVVLRHYLGEVGKYTILWLPNLLLMYLPKIVRIWQFLLEL